MVLYRKEWEWVHSRLLKIKEPTIELQTLAKMIHAALKTEMANPFYLAITDNQATWITSRTKLVTVHQRRLKA